MSYTDLVTSPLEQHVTESFDHPDVHYSRRNAFEISPPQGPEFVDEGQLEASVAVSDSTTSPGQASSRLTRTVAIIKPHGLEHRLAIEQRINEAKFEIVKERRMEFDTDTDPDTLFELFGEDAECFAEGPVWLYVLERRRAVEVWQTLMGPSDPSVARQESPTSLRALYGISARQNCVMGSSDAETAEAQIQAIFVSSPPFPTSDLPSGDERFDSMRSVASSMLEALRSATESESGVAPSSVSQESSSSKSGRTANATHSPSSDRKSSFRARPLPATHHEPDIKPRMSKAAALRAGIPFDTAPRQREPLTKERLAKTFANVPGHKRSETIQVASTAAPTIAPRMTRAASLRLGIPVPPAAPRRQSTAPGTLHGAKKGAEAPSVPRKDTFEGVPGHKRRESISVASSKPPALAPRLNKSAALRAQKDAAPPSSFMFREPSAPKVPSLSRSNSSASLNGGRPASQNSLHTPTVRRPVSTTFTRPNASKHTAIKVNGQTHPENGSAPNGATNRDGNHTALNLNKDLPAPASGTLKPKPRPSSLAAPTIAPRPNRSAMLRAAKMEAQNVAGSGKTAKAKPGAARPLAAA